ncbi:hypothetical protein AO263_25940 [Pseudomonas sp. NZIPFR-PS5]|nr:hypothetical protein AO263_25940 [Pseudomonas sp. NZIPFR-PS5]
MQVSHRQTWPRAAGSTDTGTLLNPMQLIGQHAEASICAAAYRVVHGGDRALTGAPVDSTLMRALQALALEPTPPRQRKTS